MDAHPTDAQLLDQARKGDQSAFRALVERYAPRVRKVVLGMLGSVPEADDVAQEVFVRFYERLGQFRGEAALGTYLTRMAINGALNEQRRTHNRRHHHEAHMAALWPAAADAEARRYELRDAIARALQTLDPDQRSVVVLRLIEGYSVKETAEILGIPMGTVGSRLARAQQKLIEVLKNQQV